MSKRRRRQNQSNGSSDISLSFLAQLAANQFVASINQDDKSQQQ